MSQEEQFMLQSGEANMGHILVVDDESQVRDLLALFFRKRRFKVTTASSSTETLQAAEADKPDLVVLDIGLDQEDGLKLLDALKTRWPAIKVVMLTGMGYVDDLLQEAQQKGADGYVSKVLPLDELLTTVQRVLNPLATEPALS
jgi:DNA-binding response OmpR family regulator